MEIRFDRGPLQRPTRKGRTFVVEGHAARTHRPGDGLRYAHGDEYRDAAELRAIVDQLPGIPVTLPHPPGLLKSGAQGRIVGRIDAAWVDGDRAAVRLSITDAQAASEVEAGTKELSLGYETSIDSAGYQRDSVADHLAIVTAARCGQACSLRTDERLDCAAECSCQIDRLGGSSELEASKESHMPNPAEKTDKARVDELEAAKATLDAEVARLTALVTSQATAGETEAVKAVQVKLDASEAKVARFDETFRAAVIARVKLEREAVAVMGPAFRMDDLTDRQVQDLVVKRLDASVDVASQNADQIRGRYDTLIGLASKNAESQARVAEILGSSREAARADESESHDDIEKNRWKKTLKNGRANATKEGR